MLGNLKECGSASCTDVKKTLTHSFSQMEKAAQHGQHITKTIRKKNLYIFVCLYKKYVYKKKYNKDRNVGARTWVGGHFSLHILLFLLS